MEKRGGYEPPRRGPKGGRRARMVQPREHETYRARCKSGETLRCKECGVFSHAGHWSWEAPDGVRPLPATCPACRRIHDRYPAGIIRLHGDLGSQRDELLAMIRNVEAQEKAEHPLERLMEITPERGALVVTTTGMHLARCICGALERRSHGHIRIRYAEEETQVTVDWTP